MSTALCSLVSASLDEDSYGVVQRDIPRILEALLALLTALEDYQSELSAVADEEERGRAGDVLAVATDGAPPFPPLHNKDECG